jgi:putative oxidoreductase
MSALSLKLDTPAGRWIVIAVRFALAAVLLWAAIPKLVDPAAFATDITNYRLVPEGWAGAIALMLPVLELVVAGALVIGLEARGAAVVAALMLAIFSAAMVQAMARGIDLECGCFGETVQATVGWDSIARNAILVALAGLVAYAPDVRWSALRAKAT